MCVIFRSGIFVAVAKYGRPCVGSLEMCPTFQSPSGRGGNKGIKEGAKHISSGLYKPVSTVRYLMNLPPTRIRKWLSSSGSTLA